MASLATPLGEAPLHGQKGATPHTGHLPPDRLPTGEANLCPLATHRREPLSGQKGRPTYGPTGEAALRLLATYGHRPPTGQRRGRPPIGKGAPLPLTGHLLAIQGGPTPAPHWPQRDGHRREAFAPPHSGHPLATKGREGDAFARPSPDWPPKTDLAT